MRKRNGRDTGARESEDQLYQMEIRTRHGGKRSHAHTPLYIQLQDPPGCYCETTIPRTPWGRGGKTVSTVSIRMEPDKPSHCKYGQY